MNDPVLAFLDAMGAAGIRPLEPIFNKLAAGHPVRFRAEGDKPGRRNGWACLHLDGIPAGVFRHYRLGIRETWQAGSDNRALSIHERRVINQRIRQTAELRQADTDARQRAAAANACAMWNSAGNPDPAHAYLARKSLPAFGIRQKDDALLVPMIDANFQLWNVQRILPDGRKRFLAGGRTNSLFWRHAAPMQAMTTPQQPLVVGEGFATMAAIHHATGFDVVAAMSVHNLAAVGRAIRILWPNRPLFIAADDDSHLEKNIGLDVARQVAKDLGAYLVAPAIEDSNTKRKRAGTDFSDIAPAEIKMRFALTTGGHHE